MQKLQQFKVDHHVLVPFYRLILEEYFNLVYCLISFALRNKNKLNKITDTSTKITGK